MSSPSMRMGATGCSGRGPTTLGGPLSYGKQKPMRKLRSTQGEQHYGRWWIHMDHATRHEALTGHTPEIKVYCETMEPEEEASGACTSLDRSFIRRRRRR